MTYDAAYYEDLRGRARGVLIAVAEHLSNQTAGLIDELIDHNECGVAVEMLSEALVEAGATIDEQTMADVEALVNTMELEKEVAARLRPHVETRMGTDG